MRSSSENGTIRIVEILRAIHFDFFGICFLEPLPFAASLLASPWNFARQLLVQANKSRKKRDLIAAARQLRQALSSRP
jgi:hypothetical protein